MSLVVLPQPLAGETVRNQHKLRVLAVVVDDGDSSSVRLVVTFDDHPDDNGNIAPGGITVQMAGGDVLIYPA